ncbi:MAG: iron ABC transporter permease [Ardenticatenaceae bacterium]|nr:iron ABC transporter permease [Ardenticatenaceae bacterium]
MAVTPVSRSSWRKALVRRYREFALIARDPVLLIGLLVATIFVVVLVFTPIIKVIGRGFVDSDGAFNLEYFARYVDPYYASVAWRSLGSTLLLGLLTATGGTFLGFIFAYTMVRCNPPGKKWVHILALVPTVSPPFAIAMAAILLFGRNGLITHRFLGMEFPLGSNDIYGLDGLVFVQVLTFFSVAYLIIRAMLERLHPSMEEAAHSLGASKFHIFRTITLPLLIPGLAGSFLLLFVESLADLGNPLLISGNVNVLAAQIFLAVAGEFDYQKASTLAFVLLLPTLFVFIAQRYWVSRRSYISVTGKPASGHILVKEPITRWSFILLTYATTALIVVMYASILVGSFSKVWGIDFTPSLEHWKLMLGRGVEAILDTTFLSIMATPVAGLLGMGIAFLVVRKTFSGKDVLDFGSNLGAGVPGTILGIGFILSFVTPPWVIVIALYLILGLFMVRTLFVDGRFQLFTFLIGTTIAVGLRLLQNVLSEAGLMYLLGGGFLAVAAYFLFVKHNRRHAQLLAGMGLYLMMADLIRYLAQPMARFSLSIASPFWGNATRQFADYIQVFFQVPQPILMIVYIFAAVMIIGHLAGRERLVMTILLLGLGGTLAFIGKPLAMIGTPYIIIAAFAVRSLPASVRAGVAALQQIDPSIEEASNSLGADAQYTFRKVTLPLITPALLAGLIFSFTRHMTSLSAIIFLVSPRWRIVTASILSEWEQGGISFAAAYASVIIVLVLIAIGILYFVTNRVLGGRGDVDLTLGA